MAAPDPRAFEVQAVDSYKLETYTGSPNNKSPAEARKTIKANMKNDGVHFAFNPQEFKASDIEDESELSDFGTIQFNAHNNGVIWALAHVVTDDDKYGEVIAGQPVVFDCVSAKAVTGIRDDWGTDEYTIIGIALEGFSGGSEANPFDPESEDQSYKTIPIRVQSMDVDIPDSGMCILKESLHAGSGADAYITRFGQTGLEKVPIGDSTTEFETVEIWDHKLPPGGAIPIDVRGDYKWDARSKRYILLNAGCAPNPLTITPLP